MAGNELEGVYEEGEEEIEENELDECQNEASEAQKIVSWADEAEQMDKEAITTSHMFACYNQLDKEVERSGRNQEKEKKNTATVDKKKNGVLCIRVWVRILPQPELNFTPPLDDNDARVIATQAFLDTMSEVNCIGLRFYQHFMKEIPLQVSKQRVQGVGGMEPSLGKIDLLISGARTTFQIIRDPNISVLFSFETLCSLNMKLVTNGDRCELNLEGRQLPCMKPDWQGGKITLITRDLGEFQVKSAAASKVWLPPRIPLIQPLQLQEGNLKTTFHISSELSEAQQGQLLNMLEEFDDVTKGEELQQITPHDPVHIRLQTEKPINIRQYPLGPAQREFADVFIQQLFQAGLIEPSDSPFNSPVHIVPKGDTWRFTVDYRKLNEAIVKDGFPLPRIDELLKQTHGSKFFSTLDLFSGFYQRLLAPESRKCTAFSMGDGHWQWVVLPMGLSISPPEFQRHMVQCLHGLKNVVVYVDDILAYASSWSEHQRQLRKILTRLRKNNYLLKMVKCRWGYTKIDFLGHQISYAGVEPSPSKVEKVVNLQRPTTLKQLRSFLGLMSYFRKFIPGHASIAAPLNRLLKKQEKFSWGDPQQKAFTTLKSKLVAAPILGTVDYSKERGAFKIRIDASKLGIAGVLYQFQKEKWRVIAYYSKALTSAEKNYSITEMECLAVIRTIEKFHHFLRGERFIIETDHIALTWLRTCKHPPGRLLRWTLSLSEFDFCIQHRHGDKMQEVDALSRLFKVVSLGKPENKGLLEGYHQYTMPTVNTRDFAKMQRNDEMLGKWMQLIEQAGGQGKDIPSGKLWTLGRNERLRHVFNRLKLVGQSHMLVYQTKSSWVRVVPDILKPTILFLYHDLPLAAHMGQERTRNKISRDWWWIDLTHDVRVYVKTCHKCQTAKSGRTFQDALQPYNSVWAPWYAISMDYFGPLPASKGYNYILVVTDFATKYVIIIPMRQSRRTNDKIDSVATAHALLDEVILKFGVPRILLSDQGSNFVSSVMQELYRTLSLTKKQTTPYHPQTNGRTERFNRTLKAMLKTLIKENQTDWVTHCKAIEFAYNTSEHSETKFSPFFLNFGRNAILPGNVCGDSWESELAQPELKERLLKIKRAFQKMQLMKQRKDEKIKKRHYERHGNRYIAYEEGDLVLLFTPKVRAKSNKIKLEKLWAGPYQIDSRTGRATYKLLDQEGHTCGPVNITRLKPYYLRVQQGQPMLFSWDKADDLKLQQDKQRAILQEELEEDWELHTKVATELFRIGGKPAIDMFASEKSKKAKEYVNKEQDAMGLNWRRRGRVWVNPPFRMIHEVTDKLVEEEIAATIVAPIEELEPWTEYLVEPIVMLPDVSLNICMRTCDKSPLPHQSKLQIACAFTDRRSKSMWSKLTRRVKEATKTFDFDD